jgi:hypothetical protein
VDIVVSGTVAYERYDFFDQDGRPVDVRGRFAFGMGDLIWMSGLGASPETLARVEAIGLSVEHLPANSAVGVFYRSGPTRQLGSNGDTVVRHTVRLPGYSEISIEPQRFLPNEWPRSVRITLRADGTTPSVAYRMQFPGPPPGIPTEIAGDVEALWNRICLRVRIGNAQTDRPLSRYQPMFWAPPESALEFRLESSGIVLPHHVQARDGGLIVLLDMPELALPVLRYDATRVPWKGVEDQEQVHFQIESAGSVMRGRMVQPGVVLFDPMGPTTATLRCVWPATQGFASEARGPLTVEVGVHEIRWE